MTQWYQPRQLASGLWHYTCSNSSGTRVYPVGACADNCPGHSTAKEATRHYAEWLANTEIRTHEDPDRQLKCILCSAWTQHRAQHLTGWFSNEVAVCAEHDVRAALRILVFKRYDV